MAEGALTPLPVRHRAHLRLDWLSGSAVAVGAAALLIYGIWIGALLASGHDARDFIDIGRNFVTKAHTSPVITYDASYRYPANPTGYDGQFAYYIGLDPVHARDYLDWPAYRYGRILQPALAGGLSLANPTLLPYTLLLVGWLAIGLSSGALAAWLKRKRISPWLALLYAFYAGTFIALHFDLTEALAFSLVIGGIYVFDFGPPRYRVPLSAAFFALACLARETSAIFVVVFAASLLLRGSSSGSRRPAIGETSAFLGISLVPLLAWHGLLQVWLGNPGTLPTPVVQPIPFLALIRAWPWHVITLEEIVVVVAPALLCGWLALRAIRAGTFDRYLALLLIQALVFVVFVDPFAFPDLTAASRYTIGIVIAALCSIPAIDQATGAQRGWLFASGTAWILLTPFYMLKALFG